MTDDPDPSGSTPATSGAAGITESAAARSVNTVRGEAMHAVMRYALWIRREIESGPNVRERLSRGFDEMPEVREVLEAHLDPATEPSAVVRSVYGRWFAFLLMLDNRWSTSFVTRIFPREPDGAGLRDAAWEAHVSFSNPYDHLLTVIEDEYRRGVELIGRFQGRAENAVSPENRLAEHLMVYYLRGKLALDRNGLVGRFFADAPDKLRYHALSFIGRSLKNQEGMLPRDVAMRIQALWDRRMQAVTAYRRHRRLRARALRYRLVVRLGQAGDLVVGAPADESAGPGPCSRAGRRGHRPAQGNGHLVCRYEGQGVGQILASEQDSVNLVAWTEDARVILNEAIGSGDDAARGTALNLLNFFDVQELEELVRWDQ